MASLRVRSSSSTVMPSSHVSTLWEGKCTRAWWLRGPDIVRNQDAADRIIAELKTIQPEGTASFIKQDLTLLKNVDLVCNEIKRRETKLNVLFMTAGLSSMRGRDGT